MGHLETSQQRAEPSSQVVNETDKKHWSPGHSVVALSGYLSGKKFALLKEPTLFLFNFLWELAFLIW